MFKYCVKFKSIVPWNDKALGDMKHAQVEVENIYRILLKISERKKPFGRLGHGLNCNINSLGLAVTYVTCEI